MGVGLFWQLSSVPKKMELHNIRCEGGGGSVLVIISAWGSLQCVTD